MPESLLTSCLPLLARVNRSEINSEEFTRFSLGVKPRDTLAVFSVEYTVPTIALYELYAGARRSDTTNESISTVAEALKWAEWAEFDENSAREAADIRSELLDRGEPIPAPDTLIAGVARSLGAELVATDNHFSEISQLNTVNPRE
jgi:tRNA(fMet)-specific endonuclease VapC